MPAEGALATETAIRERTDVRLFSTRVDAARRIVSDSWKDRLPSVAGLFEPLYQHPGSFFQPSRSWRAQLLFSVPVFDAGARAGRRTEREALLSQSQAALAGALRQAASDMRTAYEAVRSADRALASARAAAAQAASPQSAASHEPAGPEGPAYRW